MSKEEVSPDNGLIDGVSKINQAASKGPISALLNPSLEILGKEAAEWTQKFIDNRKANKKAHVEAVRLKIGNLENEPSEVMLRNLVKWEEQAGNFDENDPEAILWRGVLEKILTEKTDHSDLIEKVKKLNKYDIGQIIQIGQFWEEVFGTDPRSRQGILHKYISVFDPKRKARLKGNHKKLIDLDLIFVKKTISAKLSIFIITMIALFLLLVFSNKYFVLIAGVSTGLDSTDIVMIWLALLSLLLLWPIEKLDEAVFLTHTGRELYEILNKYAPRSET